MGTCQASYNEAAPWDLVIGLASIKGPVWQQYSELSAQRTRSPNAARGTLVISSCLRHEGRRQEKARGRTLQGALHTVVHQRCGKKMVRSPRSQKESPSSAAHEQQAAALELALRSCARCSEQGVLQRKQRSRVASGVRSQLLHPQRPKPHCTATPAPGRLLPLEWRSSSSYDFL